MMLHKKLIKSLMYKIYGQLYVLPSTQDFICSEYFLRIIAIRTLKYGTILQLE